MHWETATGAARELEKSSGESPAHHLTQSLNLEHALRPIFTADKPDERFDVELWSRILRFSHVPLPEWGAPQLGAEEIFRLAKEEYAVLKRVVGLEKAEQSDIDRAIKLCRGIDRGVRRTMTARSVEKF